MYLEGVKERERDRIDKLHAGEKNEHQESLGSFSLMLSFSSTATTSIKKQLEAHSFDRQLTTTHFQQYIF